MLLEPVRVAFRYIQADQSDPEDTNPTEDHMKLLEPDRANPSGKNVKITELYLPCPPGRFSIQYQGFAGILADAEA